MNALVLELLNDLGTNECIQNLPQRVDIRDLSGDYDGMSFDPDQDAYLKFVGQAGQ